MLNNGAQQKEDTEQLPGRGVTSVTVCVRLLSEQQYAMEITWTLGAIAIDLFYF